MSPSRPLPGNRVSIRLRTALTAALLALGASGLTGCASQPAQPQTMRDPEADFSAYRTFGWYEATSEDASARPLSLLESNIRSAITAELTRKGYRQADAGTSPDLLIDYETARAEKIKSNPVRIGVGVGSWGGSTGGGVSVGSPGTRNVDEGTLVVHVIDPKRKAEVFQGRASRELDKSDVQPAVVQSAVADVLREFPARSGQP